MNFMLSLFMYDFYQYAICIYNKSNILKQDISIVLCGVHFLINKIDSCTCEQLFFRRRVATVTLTPAEILRFAPMHTAVYNLGLQVN